MSKTLERTEGIVDLDMLRRQFPNSPCVSEKLHELGTVRRDLTLVLLELYFLGDDIGGSTAFRALQESCAQIDNLRPVFPEDVVKTCNTLIRNIRDALSQLNRSSHSESLL